MGLDAAIFVSKRLQRVAFALICLAAVQLGLAALTPSPKPSPVVRVAIASR